MPVVIDVNSTASLLGAFGVVDKPATPMLDLFFPYVQMFDTEEVFFDRVARARRLAPFVVPTVEGKPEPSRAYKTVGFKPPYVKPKHVLEPARALKRRAGEQIMSTGPMTPEMRFNAAILDNFELEQEEITRREEWMAMQLMLTGSVTCASEDHPPVVLDMGRNTAQTVALTGAARWGQAGIDPLANLQSWAATMQVNSGYGPNIVIMDPLAAGLLLQSARVTQIMNTFRQQSGDINLQGLITGGGIGNEIQYLGQLNTFQIFQYQQLYADNSGAIQKFMPDNTVILANKDGLNGIRLYGAIMDPRAGLMPMTRFPKMWMGEDPPRWMVMTQSAPLPVVGWVDASFAATVA